MARNEKTKELATPEQDPDPPEGIEAGTTPGVTTPGVPEVTGSVTTGGCTSLAEMLAIYQRNEKQLRSHLRRIGVLSKDLEEVMQRTVTALLEWGAHNDPPRDPLGLVRRFGTIQGRSFLREQGRHPLVAGDDCTDETPAPSSRQGLEQTVLDAERTRRLKEGIAKLPRPQATVVQTAHFEYMTHEEIAEELGISVDAVEKRYERGFAKLKELVLCHCTEDDLEPPRRRAAAVRRSGS